MEEEIITQIKMSSVGRGTEGNSRLRIEVSEGGGWIMKDGFIVRKGFDG